MSVNTDPYKIVSTAHCKATVVLFDDGSLYVLIDMDENTEEQRKFIQALIEQRDDIKITRGYAGRHIAIPYARPIQGFNIYSILERKEAILDAVPA